MCLMSLIEKHFLTLKVKESNFQEEIGGPASQVALAALPLSTVLLLLQCIY